MATGVCIDCGCVHKYSENCELNVIIFEANRYIYKNTSFDEVERIVNLTFKKLYFVLTNPEVTQNLE